MAREATTWIGGDIPKSIRKAAKEFGESGGVRVLGSIGYAFREDFARQVLRSKGPTSVKLLDSSPLPRSTGADPRRKAGVPLTAHRIRGGGEKLYLLSRVADLYDNGRTLRDGSREPGKGLLTGRGRAILDAGLQRYADAAYRVIQKDKEMFGGLL